MNVIRKALFACLTLFSTLACSEECTDILVSYIDSLKESIFKSEDEETKASLSKKLELINLYRQSMTDCKARDEMLRYLKKNDRDNVYDFITKEKE